MNTYQPPSGTAIARNYLARSLVETQLHTLQRCHEYNARAIARRQIVYAGVTALKLCRLETPLTSRLADNEFCIAYIGRNNRSHRKDTGYLRWIFRASSGNITGDVIVTNDVRNTVGMGITTSTTSTTTTLLPTQRSDGIVTAIPGAPNIRIPWNGGVIICTHPLTTWAMMAPYLSQVEVIVLADAMLRGTASDVKVTKDDIVCFLRQVDFPGKTKCSAALPFLENVTDSPMEARTVLALLSDGLPRPVTQWTMYLPELRTVAVVDMAYPDAKVIIEYDGDAHRVDKQQYRRDDRKRQAFRAHGYAVIVAFADDVMTAAGRRSLTQRVAQALGVTVTGQPLPQYAALSNDQRLAGQRDRQRRRRNRRRRRGET
ncbi:DUF559 domain-containing protein [Bifidobacterium sp. 82T24]|uniref:DUF559 domain-containing protein n=1 Tax=Bifidobacterium pluvialisilvae TaxID=2834436 RepID=UPI001C56A7A3|nr:DUF559 domain-containing protein [Bifidobacterium pluvialisilvae]MBW3088576.1 DUF559 domain-containing protein [Bifidobacterium pluvialisilvae]